MRRTQFAQPIANSPVAATSFGDLIEKQMVESEVPYPVPEDAKNFSKWRSHVLVGEVNDGNAFHIFGGVSGHAGLFASAEDLLQFGEALNSSLKGEGIFSQSVAQDFFAVGPDVGQRLGLEVGRILIMDAPRNSLAIQVFQEPSLLLHHLIIVLLFC